MSLFDADQTAPRALLQSSVRAALQLLLGRTTTAALVRFILTGTGVATFWLILIVIFDYPGEVPYAWLHTVPAPFFPLINIASTFLNPQILLHLLPVLAGLAAGLALAAFYLSDLFELETPGTSFRYLLGSLFGLSYPRVRIDRPNVAQIEANNPMARVGGPGYVQTHLGFAAVFETAEGLPRVYGQGGAAARGNASNATATPRGTFIGGFERLRDVVDLRDRIVRLERTYAETSDGVPLTAHDVQLVFRVYGGGQARDLANPYPFSEDSIRRLVYAQPIQREHQRTPDELLRRIADREVQAFIRSHSLEALVALQPISRQGGEDTPGEDNTARFQIPRRALTEHFHTEALQRRLRYLGLELDWIGVGIWQLGGAANGEGAREIDPGRTLLSAWRDFQRLRLYHSPAFMERQRRLRYRETITESLQAWLQTWQAGELPGRYRCFELLALIERQLETRFNHLPPDLRSQIEIRPVLDHLENLNRPRVLGEGEGG